MITTYFRNVITTPARRASMIERVVANLAQNNNRSEPEFDRWVRFYERLLVAHMDSTLFVTPEGGELKTALEQTNRDIMRAAWEQDIYTPKVLHAIHQRTIAGRGANAEFIETILTDDYVYASGNDRDYIERIALRNARLFTCDSCGNLHTSDTRTRTRDGSEICAQCIDDNYTFSEYYDEWIPSDDVRYAIDRNGNSVVVDEDDENFEWNDEHDTYVHIDYAARRVIRGYHDSKGHFCEITCDWTHRHNRLMGIELEVEAGNRSPDDIAARIHDIVNEGRFGHRVFFERDGSLTNGFEIITQPMGLPTIRETFGFLKDPRAIEGLRSHRTNTCGLHVHVARTGLNNLIISRAVTFVNDPRNDAFITAIARRYNTGFCKILEKEAETAHIPIDRYEAINLTPRATIEFRIFRGSLKFEAVIAAAEFCHALLEYCARAETTASSMNAQAFLTWCANSLTDDTKIMREYIAQRTAGTFAAVEAA